MWPRGHNVIYDLLWEIVVRILIIGTVVIFQMKVPPHVCHITEANLIANYKKPRQGSYIPAWAIVIIVVFIPLIFIYIIFTTTKKYVDTIQALLAWTLALSINAAITESLKLVVGRPRPDYFYRCFPNGKITCGLRCTGNIRDVLEGRKSFPSGHSSFAFCSLGFLSIWIYGKFGSTSTIKEYCYKGLVCSAPLLIAGVVAVSRFYDNHHHWEDILVGSLVGLASSYFCYEQYYFPLNSQYAGEPLTTVTEEQLLESYHSECCTRDLNDDLCLILNLNNKNSLQQ